MRIGIDATPLPAQPVGAGVYIIEIIRALAAAEAAELIVFAHPHGRRLIETMPLPGTTWVEVPNRGTGMRLTWEQAALPGLSQRLQLDLLHSLHYTRPARLPCASVVTFHDLTFFLYPRLHTRVKRVYFPYMMRLSARKADAIIAVSESTRRDAIRVLNIPAERVHTVHSGISPLFRRIEDRAVLEDCRRRYDLPERFILYVGTVEPRKNLPLLIRAYAALLQEAQPQPLVIVGRNGWMYEEVYRLVEDLRLGEHVRFTGYLPGEDLPMVYNLAEIFVYPSLYEGFGFPPLEAMACGAPVITTAVSAMEESVGDAGLLTAPGDEAALVSAIRRLSEDPDLRRSFSTIGRQRAAQFTWAHAARETLNVYRKTLSRKDSVP